MASRHDNDTPVGFIRTPDDVSLFSLALQNVRIEGRLAALQSQLLDYREGAGERDAARDEAMRLALREAVREALEPLTKRVMVLEQAQARVTWLASGVAVTASAVAWLAQNLHLLK